MARIQRIARQFRRSYAVAKPTPPSLKSAKLADPRSVEVSFTDGSSYRFHSLWLRDGCRDHSHVEASSERRLDASPLIARMPLGTGARSIEVDTAGETLKVEWEEGSVPLSTFDAGFLRAFADVCGKPIERGHVEASEGDWFSFIDGKPSSLAKPRESLRSWKQGDDVQVPRMDYNAIGSNHREFLQTLMDPGVVIVENMPEDRSYDGSILSAMAMDHLGGLQKHPRRSEAHWTISTQEEVLPSNMTASARGATNAYDTNKQLCNHTDQSLYGLPGLLLMFHCAMGEGNNSLTDGFAVAYALQDRHPEYFDVLSRHGMAAGRRLEYYTSGPLMFDTNHRVLHTDEKGGLTRVQYHESYRTPLTVPYDEFELYYSALSKFYEMVHSPEFQAHITLREGQCLIMNNWRTMHGRAGLKGKARTILGGTVTREAFYSAVRQMEQTELGLSPQEECGVPTGSYRYLAQRDALLSSVGGQQKAATA